MKGMGADNEQNLKKYLSMKNFKLQQELEHDAKTNLYVINTQNSKEFLRTSNPKDKDNIFFEGFSGNSRGGSHYNPFSTTSFKKVNCHVNHNLKF